MPQQDRAGLVQQLQHAMRVQVVAAVLVNQGIAARAGLNPVDVQALNLLSLRGPMSPTDLATSMAMSRGGAVTSVIDRLERGGYVRRTRGGADRRQVLVEPVWGPDTQRIAALFDPVGELFHDVAARYTDEQIELIGDFIRRSNAALGFDAPEEPR